MKKVFLTLVVLLLASPLVLLALGELSGEVVVLHTRDDSGASHGTRLWIVEHDGDPFLRAGARSITSPDSWYARILANPLVELERNGARKTFRALPAPEARVPVNARMREDYGLPDRLIGLMRDFDSSMPIRLESGPRSEAELPAAAAEPE